MHVRKVQVLDHKCFVLTLQLIGLANEIHGVKVTCLDVTEISEQSFFFSINKFAWEL